MFLLCFFFGHHDVDEERVLVVSGMGMQVFLAEPVETPHADVYTAFVDLRRTMVTG
jgi:hypothetical protein